MKVHLIYLLVCTLSLLLCACSEKASDIDEVNNTEIIEPINYGSGVYYFHTVDAEFGNSLSYFISNNDNLELVAMVSSEGGTTVAQKGTFVYFRTK